MKFRTVNPRDLLKLITEKKIEINNEDEEKLEAKNFKVFNGCPLPLVEYFCEKFTEIVEDEFGNKKMLISDKLKDKCLAYIFCFSLILADFKVDISIISKDLGINLTK
ncbi:hypothetical protein HK099_002263 [Clydaea vesicula]|uniref:Uncharacterized protein n=1 Tax=Clydaea vesicula TaxID=447962 RepID=A0AAD5TT25_9FUNG|nr:hypothetical protein HK099_002263 [Clydaea vesicula]